MKGLLLKDFYRFKGFFITVLIFDAVASMLAAPGFFVMLILFFEIGRFLCNYYEIEKNNVLDVTLPLSRAQMVNEKYIIMLTYAAESVIVWTISGALMLIFGKIGSREYLLGFINIALANLAGTITFPLAFRFGTQRTGFINRVISWTLMLSVIFGTFGSRKSDAKFLSGFLSLPVFIGVMVAIVVVYVLLWRLSIAAYQKRDLL